MNATCEYLLLVLCAGAATEDGVIVSFAGRDKTSSSELEVELVIKRRKCAARWVWEYMLGLCTEKCDVGSSSSLTSFGVVGPCTDRCDVEFLFVFTWVVALRPLTLQSSCLESKGGDVDLWPDVSTC